MRTAERAVLVAIVVAVALALRLGLVLVASVPEPLRADAGEYAHYAQNLLAHGVYGQGEGSPPAPDSFRSPGYPLFLAGCQWLFGAKWLTAVLIVQAVLGAAVVAVSQRLVQPLAGFWAGVVTAVLVALSPHLVISSIYVLTENLTTALVTFGLWLAFGAVGLPRLLCGALLLGWASLCNETMVLLLPAVAWPLWRTGRGRAVTFLVVGLVPFAAWTVRNQVQPLVRRGSERAIASISHGTYPGMVFEDPRWFGYPYREDPEQPQFGSSWADLFRVLGPRFEAAPLRYLKWYCFDKPFWLWGWNTVQGRGPEVYAIANSPYATQPVMQATQVGMRWLHPWVMGLAGLTAVIAALCGRRSKHWQLQALGLAALAVTAAYLLVIPDPRYLQPLRPLLFGLAVLGGSFQIALVRRKRASAARADHAEAS
jgi:hypothetical protein